MPQAIHGFLHHLSEFSAADEREFPDWESDDAYIVDGDGNIPALVYPKAPPGL